MVLAWVFIISLVVFLLFNFFLQFSLFFLSVIYDFLVSPVISAIIRILWEVEWSPVLGIFHIKKNNNNYCFKVSISPHFRFQEGARQILLLAVTLKGKIYKYMLNSCIALWNYEKHNWKVAKQEFLQFRFLLLEFLCLLWAKKIPHTGQTESLHQCG